jgi:4-hydroxybenzoate polyprenyltransferase
MGLCRALIYCAAAVTAIGTVPVAVGLAALAQLAYVAGLTYAARQESLNRVGNLWPLLVLAAPTVLAWPALIKGLVSAVVYLAMIATTAYAIYLLAARPMPRAVPRAVGILIAGVSLVDAALLAAIGADIPALVAATGFVAALLLQRGIAGT